MNREETVKELYEMQSLYNDLREYRDKQEASKKDVSLQKYVAKLETLSTEKITNFVASKYNAQDGKTYEILLNLLFQKEPDESSADDYDKVITEEFAKLKDEIYKDLNEKLISWDIEYEKRKYKLSESIRTTEGRLKDIGVIHEKYYYLAGDMARLIETGRADSVKEALNLAIEENRKEAQQDAIWEAEQDAMEREINIDVFCSSCKIKNYCTHVGTLVGGCKVY